MNQILFVSGVLLLLGAPAMAGNTATNAHINQIDVNSNGVVRVFFDTDVQNRPACPTQYTFGMAFGRQAPGRPCWPTQLRSSCRRMPCTPLARASADTMAYLKR